jgi:predicted XRE-type DNA-binding protein
MDKKRESDVPVTESSGNVFADMGLPDADEELTKAQLPSHIRQVIKRKRLTQVAAAATMRVDQPKVSALLNGRLENFSSERLMRLLTALGLDVDITVKATPRARPHPRSRRGGCMRFGTPHLGPFERQSDVPYLMTRVMLRWLADPCAKTRSPCPPFGRHPFPPFPEIRVQPQCLAINH